ncbi:MAG TPA: orotidine-5'-phosphate decarboxylase [Bryobacterales bacterium]|nr:orotidine-5'-phosphate decarboxylase [Bryobacterales bacterium]
MRQHPQTARERLIVALDFATSDAALAMADRLRGLAGFFKVGKQLFTAEGPGLVRQLVARGDKVFLDLKFHDIPNTVRSAVKAAASLGVSLIDVHASGGPAMMRAAVEAAAETGITAVAVTVLTSMDQRELAAVGFPDPPERLVLRLAKLALESGLAGVVAAPPEVGMLRRELGNDFLIVTPGIRFDASHRQDQQRIGAPEQAVRSGADFIVVGRPITQAEDPAAVARSILQVLE